MYKLSLIMLILLGFLPILAQSPHGDNLQIDCAQCHNPASWSIDYKTVKFDHNSTKFELEGMHGQTDCKQCHTTLVFNQAPSECIACHADMHSMSVGNDCARCHTPQSWLVDNIPELHEENGFPLVGAHSNLSCEDCHLSETNLRFDRIGNECISCHNQDFQSTQNPNHTISGFSTNCIECHNPLDLDWESDINHDFFPLTLGHDVQDCKQCHTTASYSDASTECITCHQSDYNQASDPNHLSSGFPTDCASCHTTNPGWSPATFDHEFFPLTLGHNIQDCKECHKTGNYSDASPECVSCHQNDFNQTVDPNHQSSNFSTDCASCHTTNPGWSPAEFPHDFFPLTSGHDQLSCKECHTTGNYSDASPECVSCHLNDYNQTNDPKHLAPNFSTDCASCHTTNPGWSPADFNHDFFPRTLGHNIQGCTQCHTTGNYSDASPECLSCHQGDYNNTTNPNHSNAQFPTDCASCHTTNPGWSPATFDHDGLYFPIYSGKHQGEWNSCTDCHANTSNYANFTCITCHTESETNKDHNGVNNYVYASNACLSCHPDGRD